MVVSYFLTARLQIHLGQKVSVRDAICVPHGASGMPSFDCGFAWIGWIFPLPGALLDAIGTERSLAFALALCHGVVLGWVYPEAL